MNKQMKYALVGILILLLAACGQMGTTPVPADTPEPVVTVTGNETNIPESVASPNPMENTPTADVANESDPEIFNQYVGLNFPPLPNGLSESFSMIIQNSDDHALSLVLDGANKMLWLSKAVQYDSNGNPHWEVMDVLGLSNVEAGLILLPDGCLLNGARDNEIFVAAKNGAIQFAWRANTTLDMFEVLSTDGIECHSDKGVGL